MTDDGNSFDGRRPVCSVSIDVDSVDCYFRIHALGSSPRAHSATALTHWLPRFQALFAEFRIRATFFFVGVDIEQSAPGRALVLELAAAGHEIGNHSHTHLYDLARRPAPEVAQDIALAHETLSAACGSAVRGFRAPGYDLSPTMLRTLESLDYLYDSSVFPAPGYYAAKAAVMAGMRLLQRPSGAVLTNPRALWAPIEPYRPNVHSPWRRGQSPVIELPIAVTKWTRTPAIGTSLLLAPSLIRRRLVDSMLARPFFNLELHAIDLADAAEDALPSELVAAQPDLRMSLADKERALRDVLSQVAAKAEFAPLVDVARARQATL